MILPSSGPRRIRARRDRRAFGRRHAVRGLDSRPGPGLLNHRPDGRSGRRTQPLPGSRGHPLPVGRARGIDHEKHTGDTPSHPCSNTGGEPSGPPVLSSNAADVVVGCRTRYEVMTEPRSDSPNRSEGALGWARPTFQSRRVRKIFGFRGRVPFRSG